MSASSDLHTQTVTALQLLEATLTHKEWIAALQEVIERHNVAIFNMEEIGEVVGTYRKIVSLIDEAYDTAPRVKDVDIEVYQPR